MVIPEIPQLHEGLLGLHIKSTDIDNGSLNANLVCGPLDKLGAKSMLHPAIEFDEPMNSVKIQVAGPDGTKIWDASYAMNGKTQLSQNAPASGGTAPQWSKICTGRGVNEVFTMRISGNGVRSGNFETSVIFTSNNSLAVKIPPATPYSRVSPPFPRLPPGPIIIGLSPQELNPISYVKFM